MTASDVGENNGLKAVLDQLGFTLVDWPPDIKSLTSADISQYGQSCAETLKSWQSVFRSERRQSKRLTSNVVRLLAKRNKLGAWDKLVGKILEVTLSAEPNFPVPGQNNISTIGADARNTPLRGHQLHAAAIILAETNLTADSLILASRFVRSKDVPLSTRLECLLAITAALTFSQELQEASEYVGRWNSICDAYLEQLRVTLAITRHLLIEKTSKCNSEKLIVNEVSSALTSIAGMIYGQKENSHMGFIHGSLESTKQHCQDDIELKHSKPILLNFTDSFSEEVYQQIHAFVRLVLQEKQIPPIHKVVVVSGRLRRIFDSSLEDNLLETISEKWRMSRMNPPAKGFSISLLDSLDPSFVHPNTLYIVCGHSLPGEDEFVQTVTKHSSVAIGWLWDNHHSYAANCKLARFLDVAIPSHHEGSNLISGIQSRTTRPLPLATCQWSTPTFQSFKDIFFNKNRKYMLTGKYSDWSVSPQRSEIVNHLNEFYGLNPLYDLSVTSPERMAFLQRSPLQNATDWSMSVSSLVLGVRKDLSTRFFDSMLCGCLPIVDREISRIALHDLKPSIEEGKHYLVCDSRDPRQILAAVKESVRLREKYYNNSLKDLLLEKHMLESRLSLIVHAALTASSWMP